MYIMEAKALLAHFARGYDIKLSTPPAEVPWRTFPMPGPERADCLYAQVTKLS